MVAKRLSQRCSVDTLLCHDDELEGRRIAFIYYLVPEWAHEDGGKLSLTLAIVSDSLQVY